MPFSIVLIILGLFILRLALAGAPYIPTENKVVRTIIESGIFKKGDRVADLGSGDGRILIALAKEGVAIKGYEINPLLAYWSRIKIKREGLEGLASVKSKNFWNIDLQEFDGIIVFGVARIMDRLEEKLYRELNKGVKVVLNYFSFPPPK